MVEELEKLENKLKRITIKEIPTTFFSIINKNFDEVTISRYLAFLMNPEYTTIKIIEQLLENAKCEEDEEDFIQLLNDGNTIFEEISIEEAVSTRSRIDIIVKLSTFWIAIENKINSYENNEQSLKYEEDIKVKTELPVKYICIKPQYNKCEMKNKKFSYILYNKIVEILKTITKYDLAKEENYYYIEEFIKHVEGFFMNENEIEISEDIELYLDNRKIIDDMTENYKKQCELVKNKIKQCIEEKLGEKYAYNGCAYYLQIWKKEWNNQNCQGVHYEILCNFNHIIAHDTQVEFAIHNESKTNKIYPEIEKKHTVKKEKYKFDTSKNIEESINKIAEEIHNIAKENDEYIDEVMKLR